ncbi:MAG: protein kinase domain-containing protein [Pirellulaceae bacterium]
MNERSIFMRALDIADAEQRRRYLDEACRGDARLRDQVERLLQSHEAAERFLEGPPPKVLRNTREVTGDEIVDASQAEPNLDFLSPSEEPNRLGKLGTYEIIEVLGHGGMGLVLRAFDAKLSRVVAIKVLAPELAANAMARQRFLREARAAAAITHPNVVTIYAVDETERLPFIVMECVQGQTLQQKIDAVGALEIEEILRIGAQTALGLAAAHAQGIVHRDVKPGNVLLENGIERVKLTDFGLARAADDVHITQTGYIAGTPQYMSPEQAEGKQIGPRSDLFSLGSVMYAMSTGRAAFRADSALAVLRRVCEDTPRPVHDVNPHVPDWLVETIDRLMAKDPAARWQSADELARFLNTQLALLQQSTLTPEPARRVPPKPTVVTSHVAGKPPRVQGATSGPARWLIAGTVLLLGTIALASGAFLALKFWHHTIARFVPEVPAQLVPEGPEGYLFIDVKDPEVVVVVTGENETHFDVAGQELVLRPGRYNIVAAKKNVAGGVRHDEYVEVKSGERHVWRRFFPTTVVAPRELHVQRDEVPVPDAPSLDGWGPALSPDGTRVVCVSREVEGPRAVLSILDVAAGEVLVTLSPDGKDPAWSPRPDGPIAFVRADQAGESIWLVEADGSGERKLIDGGFPSWSQSGETVYYYDRPSAEVRAISIADPQAQPRTLCKNPGTLYPAVSPDGTRVVARQGGKGEWLAILDIVTQQTIFQVATPGWDGLLPSWSPDGRYVGYGSYAVHDEQGLYFLDVEKGEVHRKLAGQFTMPRWSADGRRIVLDNRRHKKLIVVDAEYLGLETPRAESQEK